ncbi:hypothetical protein B0H14DRAFT_2598416 [Mycena olivaceomarginata]|nr:hypothetical protein B0H14DRAFT_2598416 [Mycena olivaceomarginata]
MIKCPHCADYKSSWMPESLNDVAIQQQLHVNPTYGTRKMTRDPVKSCAILFSSLGVLQASFDQVARCWGTRMTWGTGFFYLNRYSALFGAVPILAEVLVTTTDPRKAGKMGLAKIFGHLNKILGTSECCSKLLPLLQSLFKVSEVQQQQLGLAKNLQFPDEKQPLSHQPLDEIW